jgi:hypothetical protein
MEFKQTQVKWPAMVKRSSGPDTKEVRNPLLQTVRDSISGDRSFLIHSLTQGESVVIKTRNSSYRIIMLDRTAQMVLIRGGRHFQNPTEACLLGSAVGRKIQVGRIALGKGIGIAVGRRCFVTSPVAVIERQLDEKTSAA